MEGHGEAVEGMIRSEKSQSDFLRCWLNIKNDGPYHLLLEACKLRTLLLNKYG